MMSQKKTKGRTSVKPLVVLGDLVDTNILGDLPEGRDTSIGAAQFIPISAIEEFLMSKTLKSMRFQMNNDVLMGLSKATYPILGKDGKPVTTVHDSISVDYETVETQTLALLEEAEKLKKVAPK